MLELQARPLPIPDKVDSWFVATVTVTPEINAFIEAAVKELDLAEKNAIGEIGKIFSDAEQTPQN